MDNELKPCPWCLIAAESLEADIEALEAENAALRAELAARGPVLSEGEEGLAIRLARLERVRR
jgi:hypothetical protein